MEAKEPRPGVRRPLREPTSTALDPSPGGRMERRARRGLPRLLLTLPQAIHPPQMRQAAFLTPRAAFSSTPLEAPWVPDASPWHWSPSPCSEPVQTHGSRVSSHSQDGLRASCLPLSLSLSHTHTHTHTQTGAPLSLPPTPHRGPDACLPASSRVLGPSPPRGGWLFQEASPACSWPWSFLLALSS